MEEILIKVQEIMEKQSLENALEESEKNIEIL